MRIGVTVFLTDRAIDPIELARAVEERGFHSLYFPEHTHLPVRQSQPPTLVDGVSLDDYRRSLDPFTAIGAAAAVTERILLGTCVALVAQHDPIVLAKQIATLDHLSGGRFVLGCGYGWNRQETADHGVDFATRRERAREHVLCMQALWAHDPAEFHGQLVDLAPCYAWPKPVQQRRIRTLLGGAAGPKLFAAIAEFCDGWMPIGGAGLAQALPVLRQAVTDAGRQPEQLHVVPIGTIPSVGKLAYYESLGITEAVLRVPALRSNEVLPTLDEYAQFVG